MIPSKALQRANIWKSSPARHRGLEPFIFRAVSPKKTWTQNLTIEEAAGQGLRIKDDDHLEAVHHGNKEGDHEDVVEVGHLEEAAGHVPLHAAVDQVEIHEEIQNWNEQIFMFVYHYH